MSETPSADTTSAATPGINRLNKLARVLAGAEHGLPLTRLGGRVSEVAPSHIKVSGLAAGAELGSFVEVECGDKCILGEVIGIQEHSTTVKLYSSAPKLGLGCRAWIREELAIKPDQSWLGRVINAIGQPIDGKEPLHDGNAIYPIDRDPLAPMSLKRVREPVATGVRAVDLFSPICAGQRIGVFAGSGVGKSTLVSMLTRSSSFKTIVVALVAERSREVREFIEDVIEPSSARAVTVVATSSESAMMRKLAAKTAMTVAEYFRDRGDDVLLIVDSVTRYAHALREVALAAGEPPVARGYAPSVFAELPRLLERAGPGTAATGSITGVFSVLVDGDDHNDPVADTVRGILDGHIVLDRNIADQGRYPAINPLTSISRLASHVWSAEEATLVRRLRALISNFEDTRELRVLGAYKPGSDADLDQAVALTPMLYRFLTQLPGDQPSTKVFDELAAALAQLRSQEESQSGEAKSARPPPPSQRGLAQHATRR
ncbi:MAG: flagellar protein export ATPase FliI [Hyphomicrobiaceae bacterium]